MKLRTPIDGNEPRGVAAHNQAPEASGRRVSVWFGARVIAAAVVDPCDAAQCESGLRRRFAGCHVTNEAAS